MIKIEELYKVEQLQRYYELIVEWNKKFNLTAITEREEVFLKHFFDSLLTLEYFDSIKKDNVSILDIGSGAGLPSIPLRMFLSKERFTFVLTDSTNKKITFLRHVIEELKLENISALHTRIEEYKRRDFDIVTARAVAPLNTLCEYALPFLKIGGSFVAYKGPDTQLEESAKAISVLGGAVENIINYDLDKMSRNIIIIKKVSPSPSVYPRAQNKPRLNPL